MASTNPEPQPPRSLHTCMMIFGPSPTGYVASPCRYVITGHPILAPCTRSVKMRRELWCSPLGSLSSTALDPSLLGTFELHRTQSRRGGGEPLVSLQACSRSTALQGGASFQSLVWRHKRASCGYLGHDGAEFFH